METRETMPVWFVHPTGNANARASLDGLLESGQLENYFTTLALKENGWHSRWRPISMRRQLARRAYSLAVIERTVSRPWREILRLAAVHSKRGNALLRPNRPLHHFRVFRQLDLAVARRLATTAKLPGGILCHTDCALHSFAEAHRRGVATNYELPIAHWPTLRALLVEQRERYPDWAETISVLGYGSEVGERRQAELEASDQIFCPSQFVIDSLPAKVRSEKRIILNPYGIPDIGQPGGNISRRETVKGKLQVLFVGQLTQRKGLADLFSALRLLDDPRIELTVCGSLQMPLSFYKQQFPNFSYLPPQPREEIFRLMRECDVFVQPTHAEGRVLVVLEALANGTPVVTTPNSGCDDVVVDGKTGFLHAAGDVEDLANCLDRLISDEGVLQGLREQVALINATDLGWSCYKRTLSDQISKSAVSDF
jgi:glycosyltransferase involved in cell wall biosynthesis